MHKKSLATYFFIITCLSSVSTQSISQQYESTHSNGLIKLKSNHTVSETIDKLTSILLKKGMTIFKRVNHTAAAKKINIPLRPTELLIFGNPKVGTPLMLCSQTAAIDLPQKALAYKDESGQVWLTYNNPAYVANRHNIHDCKNALKKISGALADFAKLATE